MVSINFEGWLLLKFIDPEIYSEEILDELEEFCLMMVKARLDIKE